MFKNMMKFISTGLFGFAELSVSFLLICLLEVAVASASACKSRNLTITGDDYMALYVDGQEKTDLPFLLNYSKPDRLEIPCHTRVIAAHVDNRYSGGGILASSNDDYILSNRSWKCTNVSHLGWENVYFNDSLWPAADIVIRELESTEFSLKARWIWHRPSMDFLRDDISQVFCRKTLEVDECSFGYPVNECEPSKGKCINSIGDYSCRCHTGFKNDGSHRCVVASVSKCKARSLSITVDNSMKLYIDGEEKTDLPFADNYMAFDTVKLACHTRVIAVHGINREASAGILASSDDDYILSNESWKCTHEAHFGWQGVSYDDSLWQFASVSRKNKGDVPGISLNAVWIWLPRSSNGYYDQSKPHDQVFCRKTLDSAECERCSEFTKTTGDLPRSLLGVSILASFLFIVILIISVIVVVRLRRRKKQNAQGSKSAEVFFRDKEFHSASKVETSQGISSAFLMNNANKRNRDTRYNDTVTTSADNRNCRQLQPGSSESPETYQQLIPRNNENPNYQERNKHDIVNCEDTPPTEPHHFDSAYLEILDDRPHNYSDVYEEILP